jgi:lysophospholipase L1-like esterase
MNQRSILSTLVLALSFSHLVQCSASSAEAKLQFAAKETIVLLGDGFLEAESKTGLLEGYLTAAFPESQLSFRNLSWSGDTPRGESRSYFGPPEEGYQRLKKQLAVLQPTTVILNFGAGAAGDASLTQEVVEAGYQRLFDRIKQSNPVPKLLVLSPIPRQELGRAKESIAELNKRISSFASLSKDLAGKNGAGFIDLFGECEAFRTSTDATLTAFGAVPTASGQKTLAKLIAKALLGQLPAEPSLALLSKIQQKNELFFNQWRPANEIYLFGSRKHEQGNNAVEIPQFDPLIAAAEGEIRKLVVQKPLP